MEILTAIAAFQTSPSEAALAAAVALLPKSRENDLDSLYKLRDAVMEAMPVMAPTLREIEIKAGAAWRADRAAWDTDQWSKAHDEYLSALARKWAVDYDGRGSAAMWAAAGAAWAGEAEYPAA